jgi:hypothetical protein
LKALRVSAEAAVLAKKDAKHDVDHNCFCQSILAIMAKVRTFTTILGPGMTPRIALIH